MIPEEDIATASVQQKLADLASSLMSAAALHASGDEAGEGEANENSSSTDNTGAETMTTNPLVKKARKLLFRRLRVGVEDSRVFIGKFHCLDKQGNIILYDTVEYRQTSPPPSTTTTSSASSSGSDGQSSGGPATPAATDLATTEQRSLGLVLIPARCRTSCHEKPEQGKPIARSGYLGRFGSVFSKAGGIVSMVSKSSKKEAQFGDKFYFDEKLKRWVEEGAEAPQEEAALGPPPTAANFASKGEDATSPDAQFGVGLGAAPPVPAAKNTHLGTAPVPPSNQYSTRARQQGVRSKY